MPNAVRSSLLPRSRQNLPHTPPTAIATQFSHSPVSPLQLPPPLKQEEVDVASILLAFSGQVFNEAPEPVKIF